MDEIIEAVNQNRMDAERAREAEFSRRRDERSAYRVRKRREAVRSVTVATSAAGAAVLALVLMYWLDAVSLSGMQWGLTAALAAYGMALGVFAERMRIWRA